MTVTLFGLAILCFLGGISAAVSRIYDQQREILAALAKLTREEA